MRADMSSSSALLYWCVEEGRSGGVGGEVEW